MPDMTGTRTGPRVPVIPWRVGTSAEWAASWLKLAPGEAGRDLDTGEVRYGDGIHYWRDLPAVPNGTPTPAPAPQPGGGDSDALAAHIAAAEPHPAYDDIPSVVVLFENGLV